MTLLEEIQHAINRCNAEARSNTPDFILAEYLLACLHAFNAATIERERWYGRGPQLVEPAEARRQLHADLLAWQADGGETLAVPALHDELSARAWRAGTAGWARQPDSGHNTEIQAEG